MCQGVEQQVVYCVCYLYWVQCVGDKIVVKVGGIDG